MSLKHTDLSNRKLFWKYIVPFFSKTYVLSVGFKMKPLKKAFSSVNTKASPNFAVKSAERSNYSLLLSIWWIKFFISLYVLNKTQFFPVFPYFSMFLRGSYLQKTEDIFLTPEENLHKSCIFETNRKLSAYAKPKRILLNQNKPDWQENIPKKDHLRLLKQYRTGIPFRNIKNISGKQYVKIL